MATGGFNTLPTVVIADAEKNRQPHLHHPNRSHGPSTAPELDARFPRRSKTLVAATTQMAHSY